MRMIQGAVNLWFTAFFLLLISKNKKTSLSLFCERDVFD
ncbi:hypothetical protein EMIT013CA1_120015 [Bacillus sp. IT-13CA1]